MPGRGIQRQGREFNMPLKKEMLILNIPAGPWVLLDDFSGYFPLTKHKVDID